jgi:hypothetical protein
MKVYYYAFTGHKYGLDRARRAAAILKRLRVAGVDTMLLVNDFRAGLATRDLGVPESVHIEGIQDIDAIADVGDVVIIDSPEDDHGRLVKYCADFKQVFRFAEHDNDQSIHGEIMLTPDCKNTECISSLIVDELYFKEVEKEERTLFFLGDSDAKKIILSNAEFFKANPMELLLGHYFYVKYENDLEKIFTKLHEAEEYTELICSSSNIVTASFQTALEAVAAGANVTFIELTHLTEKEKELFKLLSVIIIIGFNNDSYKEEYNETSCIRKSNNCVNLETNDKIIEQILHKL